MRTVAISTIQKKFLLANYGSFFQHYALRRVLLGFGLRPFRVRTPGERSSLVAMLVDNAKDLLRPVLWWVKRLPNRKLCRVSSQTRNRALWLFRRDYHGLIGRFDEPQLYAFDTIGILGGDQVLYPEEGPAWWLHNVKNGNPIITYAASADWCSCGKDDGWRTLLSDELSRFSAIGIREKRGVEIVKTLVPDTIEVSHVADPVQLLKIGDFRKIQRATPVFDRKTLFCYLLNVQSQEDLFLDKYESLAASLGCELKILGMQGAERFVPIKYRVLFSPREFLRALDDSAYFVTNSYHGSILAIMYHKKFISVTQNSPMGSNQNIRQQELMSAFGIANRWVDFSVGADSMLAALGSSLDWQLIDEKLEQARNSSLDWLKRSML